MKKIKYKKQQIISAVKTYIDEKKRGNLKKLKRINELFTINYNSPHHA